MMPPLILFNFLHATETFNSKSSTIANGNFREFGNCVLKLKRFSDKTFYVDISERIIHINNLKGDLIYWIFDSNDTASKPKSPNIDLTFFEKCTVTMIIKQDFYKDAQRRINYLYYMTTDIIRSPQFCTVILIGKSSAYNGLIGLGRTATRMYFAEIQGENFELFYVCSFCLRMIQPLYRRPHISTLSQLNFKKQWVSYCQILVNLPISGFEICQNILYSREMLKLCGVRMWRVATISRQLNISFKILENSKNYWSKWQGFFILDKLLSKDILYYYERHDEF
jgi:hypothetical protein